MAQATLVGARIIDGQRLIDRLTREGVDVTSAAWIKESDSGDWYLYLATPLVREDGATKPAYRRVNAVIREMQKEGFGMDPFEIKVIGPDDPIAKDVVATRSGRPGQPPTPFRGSRLGELAIEETYIYPPLPNPEEAVGIQLWESGRIELKPGIGSAGQCRVVVIDPERKAVLQSRMYRGTVANPQSLPAGHVEVTWAEGGAARVVIADKGSAARQQWKWSQPRAIWEDGRCPPGHLLQSILSAMG